MKVSVIIPCYNQSMYIRDTLDCLLSQTYLDWECIVVNDGSTDDSVSIVRKYMQRDARIRLFEQENKGLSAARNAGLRLAQGEYIQFLDADDILLPNKLEMQVAVLEQCKSDVCVCHHTMFTDSPAQTWENELSQSTYDLTPAGFLYNWGRIFVIAIHSGLFRTSFLQQHAIIFDETVRACEDWIFWTNLSYQGAVFCEIPDKLSLYRVQASSMTQDKAYMQRNRVRAFVRMYECLPELDKIEFLQRGVNNLVDFFAISNRNVQAEQRANSIDYKFGAMALKPLHKLSSFFRHL